METVLITGGAGFIGHAVIEFLLQETNYNVVSLDRLDVSGSLQRINDILEVNPEYRQRLSVVWHDLKATLSPSVIDKLGEVNYILHLAAGSHVTRSIQYPLEFVMDNVVGTCNLLTYAKDHCPELKLFLYFSTDEVFGPAPIGVTFDEESRYNAKNPYSASKAGAEELCNAFANTYNMPIITTHTMNVYGPRQHKEKYIPLAIGLIKSGSTLTVHTDTEQNISSRCYLHSSDVAAAMLFLMSRTHKPAEKYNIAALEEFDNLSVAKKIADCMGAELKYELKYPSDTRPGNDTRYSVSGEKMRKLGWLPKVEFGDGIRDTVQWYIDNPAWGTA